MKHIAPNLKEQGFSIIAVMGIIVVMASLLAGAGALNEHTRRMMLRSTEVIDTTQAADTGVSVLYGQLQKAFNQPNGLSNAVLANLTSSFNTNTAPFSAIPTNRFRVLNYTVIPLSSNGVPSLASDNMVVDGKQNRFLSVVWVQSLRNPNIISKVQQEMQFVFNPITQFGIFYNPDLEMHNGPAMAIGGRVHSNGGIYQFNSGQLTFGGPVSSVGGVYLRGISNTFFQSRTPSASIIYSNGLPFVTGSKMLPGMFNMTNLAVGNPNASTNGARELIERPVLGMHNGTNYTISNGPALNGGDPWGPIPGAAKDGVEQVNTRLFYKADLRVLVSGTNWSGRNVPRFFTGDVTDANPNGTEIPMLNTNTVLVSGTNVNIITTNQTWVALSNAFNPNGRMSDFRQGTNPAAGNLGTHGISNVVTLDFDMRHIIDTNGNLRAELASRQFAVTNIGGNLITNQINSPMTNFNGIVYASNVDTGQLPTNRIMGVRLLNGTNLPNHVIANGVTNRSNLGLTVVTDNPLYLVGDYNTGGVGTSVGSNNSSSTDVNFNINNSTVSGYERRPAMIMADAVTITTRQFISNPSGGIGQSNMSSRRPSVRMTVNTAILAGFVPSTADYGAGGVHNFPRFIEDWNNQKLTINGSLINLFNSEQARNPFYCDNSAELSSGYRSGKTFHNYYSPPTRVWSYDPNFLDPARIPPGTPMVKEFTLGQWSRVQ